MLVQKLLSTTGKATGMGQFPFCIMAQPFSGYSACRTVRLADGVYAQAPRLFMSDISTWEYQGIVATYSSADGIRPEQTIMNYANSTSKQMSPYGKLGTKEFTVILNDTNVQFTPSGGNEGVLDLTYAEGFPIDLTSGNSTTSRGYRTYAEDGQSPTIANPPDFGTNWLAYFVLQDSTHRLLHQQGNKDDWANTEFKLIFGRDNSTSSGRGWIQRLDNGSVTWTKRMRQGTYANPYQGILCYCCGTNGEDTLVTFGDSKTISLVQANGTIAWQRDVNDANDNDTSTKFIDPTGSYAYSVDRTGDLFRINLSDGTASITGDTYATGVPSGTLVATNTVTYCGGFDSEGYLWVSNNERNCLSRIDVSGANPITVGSYRASSSFGAVSFHAPLADGDRIVSQALGGNSNKWGAWFVCLATDFSTTTIDQTDGEVYAQKYGIGSDAGGVGYFGFLSAYTTSRTGTWSSYGTTARSISFTNDTSGYDWDTNAANFDAIIGNYTGWNKTIQQTSVVS